MRCEKCGAEVESLTPVNSQDFAVYQDARLKTLITYKWARKVCGGCVRGAIQDPEFRRSDLYDQKYELGKQLERGEITPDVFTLLVRGIDERLCLLADA